MKKLLLTIMVLATAITTVAKDKETVTLIYPWGLADTPAQYSRSLAEEANKIQDKYNFVVDARSGAGGAIGTLYVKNTPNTILATGSAFYIRPNFFPNESYNMADFRELMPQCEAPLAIISRKYASWDEVPKDKPLNIGITGLGITTHLVALQIITKYPNIQAIPYKSSNESVMALISGITDFHAGFLGEAEVWKRDTKTPVHILGTTGTRSIAGYPTFVSQGFSGTLGKMSAPFQLMVPNTVSEERVKEYRSIFTKAAKAATVHETYAVDHCQPLSDMPENDLQPWVESQILHWRKLTTGVKIN